MSKTILFIHQNYPAQFGFLANYLAKKEWNVYFATGKDGFERGAQREIDGVKIIGFERHRERGEKTHRYVKELETAVLNAQGFANIGVKMRRSNINPDVVVAHSGWGSGSFCKAVWPDTKYIQYLEWWYEYPPRDQPNSVQDPKMAPHKRADVIGRNLCFMMDFQSADAVWAPTYYQSENFPDYIKNNLRVAFDGVDTEFFAPQDLDRDFTFGDTTIGKDKLLLTYATRGMEPQRGFMQFMEALSKLQSKRKDFETVIAGEDNVHYSDKLPKGDSYRKRALDQFEYDHDRLHFVGRLPLPSYRDLLTRSNAHVYLSKPFVISWSYFESASAASPLIVSDGPNSREVLPSDDMAKYVDMNDVDALAQAMDDVLNNQQKAREMGQAARAYIVENYARKTLYPEHLAYFEAVAEGRYGQGE